MRPRWLRKMPGSSDGLYYTKIKPPYEYIAMQTIFKNPKSFRIWHERLGHPGLTMMRKIVTSSLGHSINTKNFPKEFVCPACATGKLIIRPSFEKLKVEPLRFLDRIQGDICGPINPWSGPFRYFMVLIDASTRWSHVCLLSTRNHAFAKFITNHPSVCRVPREPH